MASRHLECTGHEERIDHRRYAERGLLERSTVHKGMVARTMEKMGIISDRSELNRQIKADNALLRELRGQVKKLAKDIRDKTKERRNLLSEKKALPVIHVFRHRELAAKIAVLTEDLEELRSEKKLLLASLAYTEDDAADKLPKGITAMEQNLKRLEKQEQKYSAQLDAALAEYAGLRKQAQGFAPVQLYEARQVICPGKEQEAENQVKETYGAKYSLPLMMGGRLDTERLLDDRNELKEHGLVRKQQRMFRVSDTLLRKKCSDRER